ncbi:MAG TPA: isoprenyl transferase [Gemmatimonadaceae bacterium]|nr:isoprenyl transferase [Gemmatimonadaceae bacterium]
MSTPLTNDELLAQIRVHGALPRHVAIIMDGNGRWAQERFLPRPMGHRSGMKSVRDVVEGALEAGVEVLSLFAFSRENWQRPAGEVSALMSLLEEYIARETEELVKNGVRVHVLGEVDRLTGAAAKAVARVTKETSGNDRLRLNLFISYGSRAEIARAARELAIDAKAGRLDPSAIDENLIAQRLYTSDCPDPDLLIRTSGEQRISNFLLWQIAYAELYMSPVLWPDFSRRELFEAILDFQSRDRRFGRVSV